MSCDVPEIVEWMEFVSDRSSMSFGCNIASSGVLLRECGVVMALICGMNPSGDGEMKVGLDRRDLDSILDLRSPKTCESDTTDLLVDILQYN
jgi:hypothetical protein